MKYFDPFPYYCFCTIFPIFLVHCNTSLSIVLSYLHSWHDITNHLSIHQSDSLKWTIISWNSSSSIVNFCNPLTYKFKPTKLSHVCMHTYSSYCLLYSQLKSHYIKFKRFLKQYLVVYFSYQFSIPSYELLAEDI